MSGPARHHGGVEYAAVLLACAGIILVLMVATWRVSLRIDDASIVDVVWGLGFALVAWTAWLAADGAVVRKNLLVTMATVWGLRLSLYLAWRNLGQPEDRRYAAMRRRVGAERFRRLSLFTVFLFQGLLMWIVSLPLQLGQVPESPERLQLAGVLGVALFAVGLGFETVADWQLARFKAKPWNQGRVLTTGLWRYTRHPNYFGDFCVWWGIFLVAATTPIGLASAPGPLLMTVLLMRVSGVPLTERHLARKTGYAEYVARTNAFFPGPPTSEEPETGW